MKKNIVAIIFAGCLGGIALGSVEEVKAKELKGVGTDVVSGVGAWDAGAI